jgi:hypothetical protein
LITLLLFVGIFIVCRGHCDPPYVRRIQEESPFSFLMNMKVGGEYFLYKRGGLLALGEERIEVPAY